MRDKSTAAGGSTRAWLIGAAASFSDLGFELTFGKGADYGNDHHTIFAAEAYARVLGRFVLPLLFVRYVGRFGDRMAQHDVSLGLGARF